MTDSLGRPTPWPAPGKLNLFLHIVGRRADGYHAWKKPSDLAHVTPPDRTYSGVACRAWILVDIFGFEIALLEVF